MRVLDLFSGIGLMALGLEWAGMTTVGMCEIDEWNRGELARNFPGMWIHDDIRTLAVDAVVERCGSIDLIAGGFPCQPVSVAGNRKGEADERWLWPEMFRLVSGVRPRWLLAENVPGLRTRGADRVLADLEGLGYACWPLVVGADDVGAPHRRKRVWIVAHDSRIAGGQRAERLRVGSSGEPVENAQPGGCRGWHSPEHGERQPDSTDSSSQSTVANAISGQDDEGCRIHLRPGRSLEATADAAGASVGDTPGLRCGQGRQPETEAARGLGNAGEGVADSDSIESERPGISRDMVGATGTAESEGDQWKRLRDSVGSGGETGRMADASSQRLSLDGTTQPYQQRAAPARNRWPSRPGEPQYDWEAPRLVELPLGSGPDGRAGKLARQRNKQCLKALGNAVVPQVVEMIGRAIMRVERTSLGN